MTPLGWNQLHSNHSLSQPSAPATPDLRSQLQPFQDLQPDEIQDQLQKLHIQHPDATMVVVPTQQPQAQLPQQVGGDFETSISAILTRDRGYVHQISSESSSSNSSSRKSSMTNGLIAQLLCPSPPAQPISSPQTEGLTSSSSLFAHMTAASSLPPTLNNAGRGSRKMSLQDPTTLPKHSRPQR